MAESTYPPNEVMSNQYSIAAGINTVQQALLTGQSIQNKNITIDGTNAIGDEAFVITFGGNYSFNSSVPFRMTNMYETFISNVWTWGFHFNAWSVSYNASNVRANSGVTALTPTNNSWTTYYNGFNVSAIIDTNNRWINVDYDIFL